MQINTAIPPKQEYETHLQRIRKINQHVLTLLLSTRGVQARGNNVRPSPTLYEIPFDCHSEEPMGRVDVMRAHYRISPATSCIRHLPLARVFSRDWRLVWLFYVLYDMLYLFMWFKGMKLSNTLNPSSPILWKWKMSNTLILYRFGEKVDRW